MIFEIHGAGFQNKGAELMLRATVSELSRRLPGFQAAVDPNCGPYSLRSQLGLKQIFPSRHYYYYDPSFSKGFRWQKIFSTLWRRPLGPYGCVTIGSLHGLLDIAGFAYTDQFGTWRAKNFAKLTSYYKLRQQPVILLPQALGPFEKSENREAFAKIIENSDLIFARDRQSHKYARELTTNPQKIRVAPDITLFYPNCSSSGDRQHSGYACIVPNIHLLDKKEQQWGDKYETYLVAIIERLLNRHIPIRLIAHDTSGRDMQIVQRIHKNVASPYVEIVEGQDTLALKKMIGEALVLIGSRYHSLVAAFSQAVPALTIGWSHKYQALFEDFECDHFVIAPDTPLEEVLNHVDQLSNPAINTRYRSQIAVGLDRMREANQRMWEEVIAVLSKKQLRKRSMLEKIVTLPKLLY